MTDRIKYGNSVKYLQQCNLRYWRNEFSKTFHISRSFRFNGLLANRVRGPYFHFNLWPEFRSTSAMNWSGKKPRPWTEKTRLVRCLLHLQEIEPIWKAHEVPDRYNDKLDNVARTIDAWKISTIWFESFRSRRALEQYCHWIKRGLWKGHPCLLHTAQGKQTLKIEYTSNSFL